MGKASRKKRTLIEKVPVSYAGKIKDFSKPEKTAFLQKPFLYLLLIAGLTFFVYSNTFQSPFQWDEKTFLEKNQIIKDLKYFTQPAEAQGFAYYGALKSRYIGFLTFALNYRMHGFDVKGYHIVNFSIHLINALLVYFLVILTLQTLYFVSESRGGVTPPLHGSRFTIRDARFIALFSSLLFVSHPVQTEAVTYIFQRLASLVTMFYLLSMALYIKGRLRSFSAESIARSAEGSSKKSRSYALSPVHFYFLSLVFAVCAMKTKENAFTLPVVITLYEFLFFFGPIKKRLIRLIPLILTLFIIPLTLIGIDKPAGEIIGQVQDPASMGYRGISGGDYLFTQFRVIVTYIRLLFLPIGQNIDYDYPVYHSFMTLTMIASFLFLFVIFGTGVYLIYKTRQGAAPLSPPLLRGELKGGDLTPIAAFYRLIGFGILWFFITLSIESSIIPIPMLINEYRVYLPSVGAFMAMSTGMFMLTERLRNKIPQIRTIALPAYVLIILVLSGVTYARNNVWTNEVIMWEDVAGKSPHKARPHNNLGNAYAGSKRLHDALREYQAALALKPDYPEAHNNLGNAYLDLARFNEALKECQAALKLNPSYADAHYNLGNAYLGLKQFDEAIAEYRTALKLKLDYFEAHNNLGNTYLNLRRFDEAIAEFQTVLKLNPDFVEAHFNLGNVYRNMQFYNEAVKEYQAALELKPDYFEAHNNLGNTYLNLRRFDEAVTEFQTALKLNPDFAEAHNNLAGIYFNQGRYDEAVHEEQTALKIKPDYTEARHNLEIVSKKIREREKHR